MLQLTANTVQTIQNSAVQLNAVRIVQFSVSGWPKQNNALQISTMLNSVLESVWPGWLALRIVCSAREVHQHLLHLPTSGHDSHDDDHGGGRGGDHSGDHGGDDRKTLGSQASGVTH